MRILFSVRNPAYVRHYDSVLRALAARGHAIHLVSQPGKRPWPAAALALARECPSVRLSTMPEMSLDPWWELSTRFRQSRFYLRFLKPEYANTPELLARARARAPRLAVRLGEWLGRYTAARNILVRTLDVLEQSTRSAAAFHAYVHEHAPDVVLTTPLVVLKTTQLDLARAAMELGVRNVFAVASWDHLSSKGELNFSPQRVLVWNEVQKGEATSLHALDPDTVTVTGSQVFDEWFDRQPSTTRAEFCARVGLRPDRPLLLYACSSLLEGSAPEPPFVISWARHLRASRHDVLRECSILVRPHFRRHREWRGVTFAGLDNIACWPVESDAPTEAGAKADYFDSLFHADAVTGLNTSAMIEAAVVGRPVHTVLRPEFAHSQTGTIHFHYLANETTGLLHVAETLGEHEASLAESLTRGDSNRDRSARFVQAFVRPRGRDIPATTHVVEALEHLAAGPPPAPVAVPMWTRFIRPILWPFALAASADARRTRADFRIQKDRRLVEHRRRKAAERKTEVRERP